METTELKKFLKVVGDSVHALNTIAVALSLINESTETPDGLNISWNPKDIDNSKIISRRYVEKAAIVYVVESFFEYINTITCNPLWDPLITYEKDSKKKENSKSLKISNFLKNIPNNTEENVILAELVFNWRNKIVHINSNAVISKEKVKILKNKKDYIYNKYHHFDIEKTLENYERNLITLKDSSTLISILILNARLIDDHYYGGINHKKLVSLLKNDKLFLELLSRQNVEKRFKKILQFFKHNYPMIKESEIKLILNEF